MVDCVRFEINATVHEQIEHYEKKKKKMYYFCTVITLEQQMSPELILCSYI